jgi:hypothetical protein
VKNKDVTRHSEADARASRLAQEQLNRRAGALICKALDLAESGDVAALRLCLERILPARKERAVSLTSPAVRSAADAEQLMGAIIDAMASGYVTPSQAAQMSRPIDTYVRAVLTAGIERNLAELRQLLRGRESSEPGMKP